MTKQVHHFRAGKTGLAIGITELPSRVLFEFKLSGPPLRKHKHRQAFEQWAKTVFDKYDGDPRPFVNWNLNTGETAIVL